MHDPDRAHIDHAFDQLNQQLGGRLLGLLAVVEEGDQASPCQAVVVDARVLTIGSERLPPKMLADTLVEHAFAITSEHP